MRTLAPLPAHARTPVIVSIGPYFNHSGQTGPAGPVEGTPYTPTGDAGPSARFYDFINGAHLMERGYTWVQVDLRGFGGSSGCLDWGGPGEQADVKAAVEWAARQRCRTARRCPAPGRPVSRREDAGDPLGGSLLRARGTDR